MNSALSTLIIALALATHLNLVAADWNYFKRGDDWPAQYPQCGGLHQSPIALKSDAVTSVSGLHLFIYTSGQTIQATPAENLSKPIFGLFSYVSTRMGQEGDQLVFGCDNIHIHAPSEHTINGQVFDAELHMVHKLFPQYEDKTPLRYLVISLPLDASSDIENPLLAHRIFHSTEKSISVNLSRTILSLFDDQKYFYIYDGSLTTPDCQETAEWIVFDTPLNISKNQLAELNKHFKDNPDFAGGNGNNRRLQALNGRTVWRIEYPIWIDKSPFTAAMI